MITVDSWSLNYVVLINVREFLTSRGDVFLAMVEPIPPPTEPEILVFTENLGASSALDP